MAMDRELEIGALWIRQGRSGEFWTGKIGDQEVVVFANAHKQPGERTPDFRIFKSKPRDGAAPAPRRAPAPVTADDLDDEIMF